MPTQKIKCEEFQRLHLQADAFIIPNPWDIGSARLLQNLGFKALATTSVGVAYTLGRVDGEITLEEKLNHCRELSNNTSVPINADFENGFADAPEEVAKNILKLAATGVAGCSIEDFSRETKSLYDFNFAVERVQAAVEAVATLGMPFQLTARAENLLRDNNDNNNEIEETIKRLKAFEAVGAHVLYAPAIRSLAQLKTVTRELDAPFNVLAPFIKGASLAEFEESGAKRVSLGGALNWAAVNPVLTASEEMLSKGTFNWTSKIAPGDTVKKLLQ